jgi:Fe-S-cluster containining protein
MTRRSNPSESGLKGPTDDGSGPRELWRCISACGSCCRLDPSLRSEALEALSPQQRATYLALVGPDGWCVHYDTGGQRCRIYDTRPDFCRIDALVELFGQQQEDGNALAIACCKQQIRSESGGRGRVMRRFLRAIRKPR